MTEQQKNELTGLPFLKFDYRSKDKYELVKTDFQSIVNDLARYFPRITAHDKPALVTEAIVICHDNLSPYNQVTIRIDIIRGDKAASFIEE